MPKFNSDLLDEYCDEEFGHTDWLMSYDEDGNMNVVFFKEPRQCYLDEMAEEEEEDA